MKKFSCIALILVLTLSLMAGCRSNSNTDTGSNGSTPSNVTPDGSDSGANGKGAVGDMIDDMTGNADNGRSRQPGMNMG